MGLLGKKKSARSAGRSGFGQYRPVVSLGPGGSFQREWAGVRSSACWAGLRERRARTTPAEASAIEPLVGGTSSMGVHPSGLDGNASVDACEAAGHGVDHDALTHELGRAVLVERILLEQSERLAGSMMQLRAGLSLRGACILL